MVTARLLCCIRLLSLERGLDFFTDWLESNAYFKLLPYCHFLQ